MQQLRNIRPSDTATGYRGELVSGGSSECCPCVVPKKAMTLTSMPGPDPSQRESCSVLWYLRWQVSAHAPRFALIRMRHAALYYTPHVSGNFFRASSEEPFAEL